MGEIQKSEVLVEQMNVQQGGAKHDRVSTSALDVEHQIHRQSQEIHSNRPEIQSGVSNAGIGLGHRDTMKKWNRLNTKNTGAQ